MVRLRQIGRDQFELEVGDRVFLFCYGDAVAVLDRKAGIKYEVEEVQTVTVARRIMSWMERVEGEAKTLKQREIENLLERGTGDV